MHSCRPPSVPSLTLRRVPAPDTRVAIRQHRHHPGVAKAACKALFTLTTGDDDSDADIANCGGSKIVIETMRAHKASAEIQEQACRGEQAFHQRGCSTKLMNHNLKPNQLRAKSFCLPASVPG